MCVCVRACVCVVTQKRLFNLHAFRDQACFLNSLLSTLWLYAIIVAYVCAMRVRVFIIVACGCAMRVRVFS